MWENPNEAEVIEHWNSIEFSLLMEAISLQPSYPQKKNDLHNLRSVVLTATSRGVPIPSSISLH